MTKVTAKRNRRGDNYQPGKHKPGARAPVRTAKWAPTGKEGEAPPAVNAMKHVKSSKLPEKCNAACERDQSGEMVYADPAPERQAARVRAVFIVTGLVFLALPGTLLGVWNLIVIAAWHAGTVGFLATLIFAIARRILPAFLNGPELYSAALMGASLWILSLGCFLRVSSESIAYSVGGRAWEVLPVSALLELTAIVAFVVNLALTLGQRLPAWFGPDDINASLPLYWYVKSFPPTRPLLVRGGLKTLERVRDVPRSLSLAGAAAADGADVERLLAELRTFFSQRQPRRVGRQ